MIKLTDQILTETIRKRPLDSYKGTYGKVVLIGGNHNFGGAIIMASLATVYSGAGLTTTITDASNQTSLHNWLPEAMFADINDLEQLTQLVLSADVIVIGPGLGTDAKALTVLQLVLKLVTLKQTLIIDGSAITLIANHRLIIPQTKYTVLTPHQMEWQRISGIAIKDQHPDQNWLVAHQLGATVVLKSHQTEIYTDTKIYQNTAGTPAQATGGMGDTLAGMVGGFCAQFANQDNAVLAAVFSHSAIANQLAQSQYVILPHQISQQIPQFMAKYAN